MSGLLTMQRETDDAGRVKARIIQADDTALIAAVLIGEAFSGKSPYLRIDGNTLTVSDDFGAAVTYRIGEYVMDGVGHGFALRRTSPFEVEAS